MKRCALFFCLAPIFVSAQVYVNTGTMYSRTIIVMNAQQVEYLKKANTYFIVPESMNDQTGFLTETFEKVWTFNEIKAISLSEAGDVPAGRNAFFNIVGVMYEEVLYILMQLSIDIPKGDPVFKRAGDQIFAGFYLSADAGCYSELMRLIREYGTDHTLIRFHGKEESNDAYSNFYYSATKYNNMYAGQICTYLAIINESLVDADTRARGTWGLLNVADETEIENLKTETLHVPDYLLKAQKMFAYKVTTVTTTEAELLAYYTYPYKMVSADEISKLILSSTSPVYYLDYVNTGWCSFIVIFNSQTHHAVYAKYANGTIPGPATFKDIMAKINGEVKKGPSNPFNK